MEAEKQDAHSALPALVMNQIWEGAQGRRLGLCLCTGMVVPFSEVRPGQDERAGEGH